MYYYTWRKIGKLRTIERMATQMESTKLENSITYGETQVKYLQDEIDNEIRYQRRIKREKVENKRNFNKYFNVVWVLSFIVFSFGSVIMMFAQTSKEAHTGENGEWVALSEGNYSDAYAGIAGILLGPFVIFSVIGIIKYVPKLINYLKQLKGTEDPRSSGYKTYEDLMAISEGRMKYLHEELTQTIVKLEADKLELEEVRRIGEGELETIEMDELFALKQEAEKEKEEPLLIEEEYQKDIGVTVSRKEAGDKTGKSKRK